MKFRKNPSGDSAENQIAAYRAVCAIRAAEIALDTPPGRTRPVNVAEIRLIAGNEFLVDLTAEEAETALHIARSRRTGTAPTAEPVRENLRRRASAAPENGPRNPDNVIQFPTIGSGVDREVRRHVPHPGRPALALRAGMAGVGLAGAAVLYAVVVVTYNLGHSGVPAALIALVYSAMAGGALRAARELPTARNVAVTKWGVFQRWTETLD